jgi:predicted PolB exonuclease-like 3'-5' exonuclease
MNIYLDIETLPTTDANLIAEMAKTITAPGQYKKQDSIDAWLSENRESALKELVAKTSFDGIFGSIACICYAFDDGEIYSVDMNSSGDEKTMLEHIYSHVFDQTAVAHHSGMANSAATFVGHNIAGFDLPFLKHRSIIQNVKPPVAVLRAMAAKPWGAEIADTILMWSPEREKRVSMDKLCRAFGIPGKGDFDGSMIAETWPVDPQKVISYCKGDVDRTRQIYKRLTFANATAELERIAA